MVKHKKAALEEILKRRTNTDFGQVPYFRTEPPSPASTTFARLLLVRAIFVISDKHTALCRFLSVPIEDAEMNRGAVILLGAPAAARY
jgi:hypothetical protein